MNDDNALINPKALARDAAMGAAVGGILGGGQLAAGQAINAGRNIQYGRRLGGDAEVIRGLIDSGLEAPEGTTARRYAQALDAKEKAGAMITAYERGRMAELNELQIQTETSPEDAIRDADIFDRNSRAYRHAQRLQEIIKNGGTVTDNEIRIQKALNTQQGTQDRAWRDTVDRSLGVRTSVGDVVDSAGNAKRGQIQGTNIRLNPFAGRALNETARHEYGHRVRDLSGVELTSAGYETAVQRRIDAYGLSRAEAEDETTADFAKSLLNERDFANKGKFRLARRLSERLTHLSGTVTTADGDVITKREAQRMREQLLDAVATAVNNRTQAGRADVRYAFGITQSDIDSYIDLAYEQKNTQDYKKYAKPSERLIKDIGVDMPNIADYSHAIRDNDIRHIRNSHGETTNEKYPVTRDDIKKIPYIVENYDKVFFYPKGNKQGILYVKAASNGIVYFIEQATEKYGNEKLLVNKQMIKTGIDDIPNIRELSNAITKKQNLTEFLNDLKQAQQVYVQNVRQPNSNPTIPQSNPFVKRFSRDINRAEQNKADKKQYGVSINAYTKEIMFNITAYKEPVQTQKDDLSVFKSRLFMCCNTEIKTMYQKPNKSLTSPESPFGTFFTTTFI